MSFYNNKNKLICIHSKILILIDFDCLMISSKINILSNEKITDLITGFDGYFLRVIYHKIK